MAKYKFTYIFNATNNNVSNIIHKTNIVHRLVLFLSQHTNIHTQTALNNTFKHFSYKISLKMNFISKVLFLFFSICIFIKMSDQFLNINNGSSVITSLSSTAIAIVNKYYSPFTGTVNTFNGNGNKSSISNDILNAILMKLENIAYRIETPLNLNNETYRQHNIWLASSYNEFR